MITVLILTVAVVTALVLTLLAVVVAGIRQEPPATKLSIRPPGKIAAVVRRLLGVSVRRPPPWIDPYEQDVKPDLRAGALL